MHSLFQAVGDCRERMPLGVNPGEGAASGEFAAAFVFPPDFCGFAGHFPGNPVLPGIAQIMAVLHACGGEPPSALLAVTSCKFLRPVGPGERVIAEGKRTASANGVAVTATARVGDAVCAVMKLELTTCIC